VWDKSSRTSVFVPAGAEQLEKSREVVRRLKEERQKVIEEADKEKEALVQEISRGKTAAISLMQVSLDIVYYVHNSHTYVLFHSTG